MKHFLTFIILFISIQSFSQIKVNKKIKSDDKKIKIKVDGSVDGNPVHYNRTFDVKGWSKMQKDSLVNFVMDSLKVNEKKEEKN